MLQHACTQQELRNAVNFRLYQLADKKEAAKQIAPTPLQQDTSATSFGSMPALTFISLGSTNTTHNYFGGTNNGALASASSRSNRAEGGAGTVVFIMIVVAVCLATVGAAFYQLYEMWQQPGESSNVKASKTALALVPGLMLGAAFYFGLFVPGGFTLTTTNFWISAASSVLLGLGLSLLLAYCLKRQFWPIDAGNAIKPLEDAGILQQAANGERSALIQIQAYMDVMAKQEPAYSVQPQATVATAVPPPATQYPQHNQQPEWEGTPSAPADDSNGNPIKNENGGPQQTPQTFGQTVAV